MACQNLFLGQKANPKNLNQFFVWLLDLKIIIMEAFISKAKTNCVSWLCERGQRTHFLRGFITTDDHVLFILVFLCNFISERL